MWSASSNIQPTEASLDDSDEDYSPVIKKPKQKKSSWNEKSMQEALQSCRNQEIGVEEASLIYGVPKRSLRTRLKDKNFHAIDDKYRVFVLNPYPAEAEADLVQYLQELIACQFTFSSTEVRRLGYEIVSEKYPLNDLPQDKDCILGNRWYKNFISKYPHLETENNSPQRCFDKKSSSFYDALESLIATHQIDASRIFSVDGIELKFRASNADDFDKIFHRRKIIYTDAKAICCISPAGVFVPPIFIKPQENVDLNTADMCHKNMKDLFEEDGYSNEFLGHTVGVDEEAFSSTGQPTFKLTTAYDQLKEMCNSKFPVLPSSEDIANIKKQIRAHLNKKVQPMSEESEEELREKLFEQFKQLRNKIVLKYESSLNAVSAEIFHGWLQKFVAYVKPNPQQRILLLLSDQSYVKILRSLELAKAHGISFLVLPPHSVHKIYPLDGFTMSLNRNLSTNASTWLGKNSDFKIEQVPLNFLFKKAYGDTVNPSIAKNGFLYSGIWPVNRNIFDSTELGGESLLLQNCNQSNGMGQISVSTNSQTNSTRFGLPDVTKDLDKLCRICMKEKMYMKPLFDGLGNTEVNYHGKKISEITLKPIIPEDGLPRWICQYCLVQLMDTVKIRNLAIESHKKQTKLRETLDRMFFEGDDGKGRMLLADFQYENSNQSKILNRELTKDFDINSLCRICMGEKPLMTSMFFKPQGESKFCIDTYRKVTEVSQCNVHIHDGLSSSICPFCLASINQASEFIQKVLGSDKRFREIISELKQNQGLN